MVLENIFATTDDVNLYIFSFGDENIIEDLALFRDDV